MLTRAAMIGLEANLINRANGWEVLAAENWLGNLIVPAHIALIQSEISEAYEAWTLNEIEHFREELADVLIRVFSVMRGLNLVLPTESRYPDAPTLCMVAAAAGARSPDVDTMHESVALFHLDASRALEAFRKNDKESFCIQLGLLTERVLVVFAANGADIEKEIAAKLLKNQKRGIRHGGVKKV